MQRRRSVVIVQRRLTHYRLALFEALRRRLAERGIGLRLLAGEPTPEERQRRDGAALDWALPIPTYYAAGGRLCWQRFGARLAGADLVVVTQENKLLANHLLLLKPRGYRLAFWGHGANLQSDRPQGLRERFKRWTSRRVDWWFAYTRLSAELVARSGFPRERISVLDNAVDTLEMRRWRDTLTPEELLALRTALGFGAGPVGAFVGSLHADKRLDFLFEAALAIRRQVPDFQLLVVGDGPQRAQVRAWCGGHAWVRWAGARFGREKVAHLGVADVLLNPGLVGLGILDAFACAVPLITTDCGKHSPEIAYLESGHNGLMTPDTLADYAAAVVRVLREPPVLATLRAGCAASAADYGIEPMSRKFAEGIEACLDAPPLERAAP